MSDTLFFVVFFSLFSALFIATKDTYVNAIHTDCAENLYSIQSK